MTTQIVSKPADNHRCQLCGSSATLTASGQLTSLAVRMSHDRKGKQRIYVKYICDDCVALFNTTNWPKTRRALKLLRKGGIVSPHTIGRH